MKKCLNLQAIKMNFKMQNGENDVGIALLSMTQEADFMP